jgi:hypothetical protein
MVVPRPSACRYWRWDPALTGFDEAESFKQRRDLAGLENWQRACHYAT